MFNISLLFSLSLAFVAPNITIRMKFPVLLTDTLTQEIHTLQWLYFTPICGNFELRCVKNDADGKYIERSHAKTKKWTSGLNIVFTSWVVKCYS